jgi:hypothetical protein
MQPTRRSITPQVLGGSDQDSVVVICFHQNLSYVTTHQRRALRAPARQAGKASTWLVSNPPRLTWPAAKWLKDHPLDCG